jgi:hypothetical protein
LFAYLSGSRTKHGQSQALYSLPEGGLEVLDLAGGKITTKASLTRFVRDSNVDHSELLTLFHSHFNYATIPLAGRVRRFGEPNQGRYLDVHFNKDGTITNLDGKLSASDQRALMHKIRSTLLENQKQAFGQAICFAQNNSVNGFYRYRDAFQIVPIPPDAPHAPMIVADHPFRLEFQYVSCADAMIDTYRRIATAAKLTRILNTLCNTSVSTRSTYARYFWGMLADVTPITFQWIQEGYGYSDFSPQLDSFSSTEQLSPVRTYPPHQYYDDMFFPGDYALALPASIERYLDKVSSLPESLATSFERASIWFARIQDLWPHASSSALVAAVTAIETLLAKDAEKCSECGQPKYSITRKFKEFLRIHVPGVESDFPEEFAAIYKTRSNLAHGEVMLMADLRPWQFFGDTLQQWQAKFQRNTYRIIGTALRNWVLAAPTTAK